MFNPRWPHTLTAWRDALDEDGLPTTDEDGNPTPSQITFDKVIYDSRWNPTFGADGNFKTEQVAEMPWGYRTSTGGIRAAGDVFKTDFKISCPMFLNHLEEGVRLVLTDSTHTFNAVVEKSTTYNWGTDIWLVNQGNNGDIPESE